jgi:hypothetical protein
MVQSFGTTWISRNKLRMSLKFHGHTASVRAAAEFVLS